MIGNHPPDAQATRQRLLEAAAGEFARYGIAGARVARIAAASGSNKAQIYHYFGGKDELFDAVWDDLVTRVVREEPFDATDLPAYAARLAAGYAADPRVNRLITWQRLERANDPPHPVAIRNFADQVQALEAAQQSGLVSDHIRAGALLAMVIHVAAFHAFMSPTIAIAAEADAACATADVVTETIRRLTASRP